MTQKDNINFIFQFNNKKRSTNFFLLYIASGVIFLGAAFYFVAKNMNYPLIATIVAAVAYFIAFNKIKPSFFEMLVTEEKLQLHYYSVSSAVRTYQSVEIPLNELKDFAVVKNFMGLRRNLIVSVSSKYGIADYPPISVSILKKKEKAQIIHVLNQIIKANAEP